MTFLLKNNVDMKEQILAFQQAHEKEIESIQKNYPVIRYVITEDQDYPFSFHLNGEKQGICYDIISYLKEVLGVEFEPVEESDYQSAVEQLQKNEVQILTGIPYIVELKESNQDDNESNIEEDISVINNVTFSEMFGTSRLILAGRKVEETEYNEEVIPYFYWGTEEQYLFASKKVDSLTGHVISYNSFEELVAAIQEEEIQGLLIKERNFDYLVDNLLKEVPEKALVTSYVLEERLAFSEENPDLNDMINQVLTLYVKNHTVEEWIDEHNTTKQSMVLEEGLKPIKDVAIVGLPVILCICFLLFFCRLKNRKRKNKIFHELECRLITEKDFNSEMFYIDFGKGRIYGKRLFKLFEITERHKHMKISELTRLTGYDYGAHYKNILRKAEEEFTEEYDMYINGEKYHMIERGVFLGCCVVTQVKRSRFSRNTPSLS